MNELDKLRKILDEAHIPYENYQEEGIFKRNQVIYGRYGIGLWKIDGMCCGWGAEKGLIETCGYLGTNETGEPMVMTAQEVFDIIKADWEKENKQ